MDYNAELDDLDADQIGARLEVARLSNFPDISIAAMAQKLYANYGVSKSTYYGHERGTRKPPMAMLRNYAEFFGLPIEYFLFGSGQEDREARARNAAARHRQSLRIDSGLTLTTPVNQRLQKENLPSSPNGEMRLIVRLMAKDIEKIARGEISIDEVDGETLPVPAILPLGQQVFWWKIPDYDCSMMGTAGESALPPGTLCLVDRQATIEPGRFVLALLRGATEPIVRQYASDRHWQPGVRFALRATNLLSEEITVGAEEECLLLARIIFSGSLR